MTGATTGPRRAHDVAVGPRVAEVALALLGFRALVTEEATLVERGRWHGGYFLSHFTVDCNAFAVAVLL